MVKTDEITEEAEVSRQLAITDSDFYDTYMTSTRAEYAVGLLLKTRFSSAIAFTSTAMTDTGSSPLFDLADLHRVGYARLRLLTLYVAGIYVYAL